MKKFKRETKGITLVALVITIIILLILAGIVISSLTGENGLITRAQQARSETEQAQKEEQDRLAEFEQLLNNNVVSEEQFDEEKQVNAPKLTTSSNSREDTGLIPVKWNGSNWEVCSEDDPGWYNYSAESIQTEDGQTVPKMTWANAMLSDGTVKKGTAQPGDPVPENEEGSMFVWIPRYAYSIDEYKTQGPADSANGTTQEITTVEFLKGNTNTGSSGTEYGTDYNPDEVNSGDSTPMIVHPAFTFGGTNLTGIWVAKFEASMAEENNNTTANNNKTDKTIKIVPNAETWRYIQVGNIFTNCLNMKDNSIYQMASGTNSHLLKNNEWGAVAYLAASQYGVIPAKNALVESYTEDGSTKYHEYAAAKDYKANTNQSTTGNVSGIYDMNGGAWEYVAAYWDNGSSYLSGQGTSTYFPSNKLDSTYSAYWDRYESSQYEIENGANIWNNMKTTEGNKGNYQIAKNRVDLMRNIKGDAMYEAINEWSYYGRYGKEYTSGSTHYNAFDYTAWLKPTIVNGELTDTGEGSLWQYGTGLYGGDFTLVGTYYLPFLLRGGKWDDGSDSGVFASGGGDGDAVDNERFSSCARVVAL